VRYWAVRAEADIAERARRLKREAEVHEARSIARHQLSQLRSAGRTFAADHWARGIVEALLPLCQAEIARLEGRNDPNAWSAAADTLATAPFAPYFEAYARWRAGTALLTQRAVISRATAKAQLSTAHRIASELRAGALRTDIERVAARAHLSLTEAPATSVSVSGNAPVTAT